MKILIKSFFIFIFFINSSFAKTDTSVQVKAFIEDISKKTISVLADNIPDKEKSAQLSALFLKTIDVKWIGKFAMGRYYNTLSEDEKTKYDKLFSDFLILSYVPHFKKYTKETVNIISVKQQSSNEYLVKTEIVRTNQESLKINYMVKDNSSSHPMIVDIIAEGISLINTKRSEFESIISSKGVEQLINMLEQKVKKAAVS
jgi:phospholipid transport system substrate-binding protein